MNTMNTTNDANGYTNRPTWAVSLWIGQNPATLQELQTLAANTAPEDLEDAIRRYFADTNNPMADKGSLYNDLITWALGQVNWAEIAAIINEPA
jgi:hypothetical protein